MISTIKPISILIMVVFLVIGFTISSTFLIAGYWAQPSAATPNGGVIRPVANEGDNTIYMTSKVLQIEGNFAPASGALYVDTTNHRVGIGTTNPEVELDVTGGALRIAGIAGPFLCRASNLGAIYFNTTVDLAYICTTSDWRVLPIDLDGDGQVG